MEALIWFGIVFCVSQSAMFSGLNLAFFSISRLPLEIESNNNKTSINLIHKNPHLLNIYPLFFLLDIKSRENKGIEIVNSQLI